MCIAAVSFTLSTSVPIFIPLVLYICIIILFLLHSAQYKVLLYSDIAVGRLLSVIKTVELFSPSRSDVCIERLLAQYNVEDIMEFKFVKQS